MHKKWAQVVAIDGPSGSGKSTIASILASKLGLLYINTGAMFRALALYWKEEGEPEDQLFKESLKKLNLTYGKGLDFIKINGMDRSKDIFQHNISILSSTISKKGYVREYLLTFQRNLAMNNFVVMEGRDIQTVVFPDAFCKIFLTASPEERAKRRLLELKDKGNNDITLEELIYDLKARDQQDSQRKLAPLKMAEDAYLLDCSKLTLEEVTDKILIYVKKRALELNIKL